MQVPDPFLQPEEERVPALSTFIMQQPRQEAAIPEQGTRARLTSYEIAPL